MKMSNAPESWFSRNGQWIWPLGMSIMPILVLLLMSSLGVTIAAWVQIVNYVVSCLGLCISGIQARLTGTVSAQVFCYLVAVVGCTMAIWRLVHD
ncbi:MULTISPECIES: hypothetical protein [Mycetohabitans]|uniref:Uncharacterized protein n=1 Tax=Mycetohabitans rhizoxinica TaxID=412963 RepID=A0ABZ2Q4D0_9BURK|nr:MULTISPECIES: hypothetical protein [unclassified Mycetohabitans]MCF7697077.1 hypothetical protein [Mycetohabitans sp. B2]MCG1048727.1 hypothetical protein [Mycetohabitans sp. B6]